MLSIFVVDGPQEWQTVAVYLHRLAASESLSHVVARKYPALVVYKKKHIISLVLTLESGGMRLSIAGISDSPFERVPDVVANAGAKALLGSDYKERIESARSSVRHFYRNKSKTPGRG
jgi:hypothetical protein